MNDAPNIPARYTATSTYEAVKDALIAITQSAAPMLNEEKLARFELCLAETLNNIVEHSYREQPNHKIEIYLDTDGNCIRTTIQDQGVPNPVLTQASTMPEPEDLAEGGFGVSLIRKIASKIDYERRNGANITTIWHQL